jgi:hypothetical protein
MVVFITDDEIKSQRLQDEKKEKYVVLPNE